MMAADRYHAYRSRSLLGVGASVLCVLALVLPAAACGRRSADTGALGPSPSPSAVGTTARPTPSVGASRGPSTADQLADFFAAAQRVDGQLRNAAALFNEGVSTVAIRIDAPTQAALRAISLDAVVRTIPGGMPAELQRKVLLVYSELNARLAAFNPVVWEHQAGQVIPAASDDAKGLLRCLAGGAAPAADFADDLAGTRSLAASLPPISVAAPDSHATAEVVLQTVYIGKWNSGCGACGGWVYTTPVPVAWKQGGTSDTGFKTDGTIAGIPFQADYHQGQGWQVLIEAC